MSSSHIHSAARAFGLGRGKTPRWTAVLLGRLRFARGVVAAPQGARIT